MKKVFKWLLIVTAIATACAIIYFDINRGEFLFDRLILGWKEMYGASLILSLTLVFLAMMFEYDKRRLGKSVSILIQEKDKAEDFLRTEVGNNKHLNREIDKWRETNMNLSKSIEKLDKELSDVKKWNSAKTTRILELENDNKILGDKIITLTLKDNSQKEEIEKLKKICAPSLVKPTHIPNTHKKKRTPKKK